MPLDNTAKSDLLLLVVTLLAALGWILSREAVTVMPPLQFMSIRFLLASAFLALFARKQLPTIGLSGLIRCLRVGAVFGIAMSFWVVGLQQSSHVGEAAFIASLGVIMVPLIARLFFGEAIPFYTWLAMPFAVTGLAFLSLSHGLRLESAQILLLVSAAIFALYFNLNTRAANSQSTTLADGRTSETAKIPVLALTTVVLGSVGIITGLLSLMLEPWTKTLTEFKPIFAFWIIASALISTALRFLVQTYAQSLTRHSNGVVIMILEPVWVAIIAAFWFAESMSGAQLIGCGLIFLSLLVNRLKVVSSLIRRLYR
ncbi:drug/metabolite transporter (DMT)-like permease [Litorivivens lipolytica]|uniref:Drug/metabolite transporter (DMT)-like permease n=1 Tax=Litorivivens lipolytica TaxID=1524264 RepID=A0A7W4Z5W1_9GAMM|nr:DMT family transporter [Litorivivens lipolytica]MBB3047914.1 drug/metabolite transporter (DMT)-like permease [Litorivivens lipolytica]